MNKDTKTQGLKLGDIASMLSSNASVNVNVDDGTSDLMDDEGNPIDPLKDEEDLEDKDNTDIDDDSDDKSTLQDNEDKKDDLNKDQKDGNDSEDVDDLSELEPQLAPYVQEKLFEELGWEITDENKVQDIKSIVDILKNAVEESSKPSYANDEIAQIDEFVKNGGSVRDYFSTRYSEGLDLEKVDLEKQIDQERVLRESLKVQGYTNERIDKRIQRCDDTGILQDEAEDALDFLKKYKEKEAEKLLKEQEKIRKAEETRQQKFLNDVTSYIDNAKDIMGVPLTKEHKAKLKVNLLKVGDDGLTEYQRRYDKSIVSNLIDSVFLTTMRDVFENRSNSKKTSDAAKAIKQKIQSSKLNLRQKGSNSHDDDSISLFRQVAAGLK